MASTDATIAGACVLDGRENHDPAAQPPGLWVTSISNRWYAFTRSMPIRGRAADGEVLVAVDDRPLDWRLLLACGVRPRGPCSYRVPASPRRDVRRE